MIEHIRIRNLKNIQEESFDFAPLTIITGLNSTGKSTLIQSALIFSKINSKDGEIILKDISSDFETIRDKCVKENPVIVSFKIDGEEYDYNIFKDKIISDVKPGINPLRIEDNLFYLSANRIGFDEKEKNSNHYISGIDGSYIPATFDREKNNPVIPSMIKDHNIVNTLSDQVNYWLSYIFSIHFELVTESIGEDIIMKYKSEGLEGIKPMQLGSGISYLAKVLILSLRARENDVLIFENPEVYLHPAAKSRLGEFFTYIVNSGVQVIMETHCEHLLNRIQYEIFKKRFAYNNAIILYKGGLKEHFQTITFNEEGQFKQNFPEGFFDATLDYLLEME